MLVKGPIDLVGRQMVTVPPVLLNHCTSHEYMTCDDGVDLMSGDVSQLIPSGPSHQWFVSDTPHDSGTTACLLIMLNSL